MTKSIDQHLVVKSNALIRASYKLTLNEQRLILLVVAGLNSKRSAIRPGFNQVEGIRISAAEFAEAWKLSPKVAYEALRDAANDLYERSIVEITGKRTDKMRWVSSISYHDGEGWASLSLSPQVTPHLTALANGNFTEYRIGQVANLRSTYAVRIFEWCIQFVDTGWMQVSLDDLTRRLDVGYKLYNDIRRKVIEPAVKELKAKSNLDIDWEPVRDGRAVKAIRFTFKEQVQRKLDL
jgi:plasmid replication initiation protein